MTKREEADALVAEMVAGIVVHTGAITSFQRVATAGLPAIIPAMVAENAAFLRKIAPQVMIGDVQEFIRKGGPEALAHGMAELTARSAAEVVDAASLVFVHAVIDDVALTCCKITTLLAPEEWEDQLAKRQVSLADVQESTYAELLENAISRRLDELQKASLLEKLDVLFARCRPKPGWTPFTDGTKYDRDRVERLDKARHRVIHEPLLRVDLPGFADDFWYLLRLPFVMIALLHERFGLGIVPEDIQKALRARATPAEP